MHSSEAEPLARPPTSFRPELITDGGRVAYRGPPFEAHTHASTADVVLVAFGGTLDVQSAQGHLRGVRVATVPSGVERRYVLCAPSIAVLWVDRRDELVAALQLSQKCGELRGGDAPWLAEALAGPDPLRSLHFGMRSAREPRVELLLRALERPDGLERGVHELAAELGGSPWHLMRALKKETGITFRQLKLLRRLTRAILAYQRWGAWTPAALEAGFSSPSHFSDSFKSAFGLPATQLLHERSFGAEDEAAPVAPHYKAASLVTVRNMLRARGVTLQGLSQEELAAFLSLVPGDWVPYALAARIYDAASHALYPGPAPIEALGRDLARDHLNGRYRAVVGEYSIEALMAAAPALWRLYNSAGSLKVSRSGPRSLRFTVIDFPTYGEIMSASLAGYIAGSLDPAGLGEVTTARHFEGERQHIDATW